MLLKKSGKGSLIPVRSFLGRYLWNKKTISVFLLAIFLIGFIFGLGISYFYDSTDNVALVARGAASKMLSAVGLNSLERDKIWTEVKFWTLVIWHEYPKISVNYFKGAISNPEHIDIDIKFDDFQRLAYKREIALADGILINSDEDYVPAKIRYQNRIIDVRLRLKGDWAEDNLAGDKWSLRIKVIGDNTLFGMKIFSIQDPAVRSYLNEWLYHQALKREGILSLRYEFVDISINGDHKGIYALEEHFEDRLLAHNGLREGPIIRFDEGMYWLLRPSVTDDQEAYLMSSIDAFQTGKILKNPTRYAQFIKAKDLLESFREGSLLTSEVFDVDKLAKFMAISDIMQAPHGVRWHNMRFYYNPITSKLEPIGFDGMPGGNLFVTHAMVPICSQRIYIVYKMRIFGDMVFFRKYLEELERVSQKSYMDDLFTEVNDELQRNMAILHKDYPWYEFPKEVFYSNLYGTSLEMISEIVKKEWHRFNLDIQ